MPLIKPITDAVKKLLQKRITEYLCKKLGRFCNPRTYCPACWAWWNRRSLLSRMVLLGWMFSLLLFPFPYNPFALEINDSGVDWILSKFYKGIAPIGDTPPFVLLEINAQTYREWGEPAEMPHDKILQLLQYTVAGGAKTVIIDVDISRRQGGDGQSLGEADRKLLEFIETYDRVYCTVSPCPELILLRGFQSQLDSAGRESNSKYPHLRPSFLDAAVQQNAHVHWASSRFALERDRVLRRWHLWAAACDSNGNPVVLPSMQLLAAAVISDPRQGAQSLQESLQVFLPQDCAASPSSPTARPQSAPFTLVGKDIDLQPSHLGRRIVYTIPWKTKGEGRARTLDQKHFLLTAMAASNVMVDNPSPELVSGSVSVIGGSYAESRDLYMTPIGYMPGALVIVNSIHSLLQYGELKTPPWYSRMLVEFGLVLLASLIFIRLTSFWGMVLVGGAIMLAILPLSFFLLDTYSIWIDSAIPTLIMQLYRMQQEFESNKVKSNNDQEKTV